MGKQSSRLFFNGKDHKDIYFQGHYHKAMYLGSELVWEKKDDYEGFEFIVDSEINGKVVFYASGSISIDWGDGTSSKYYYNDLNTPISHEYVEGLEECKVRIIGNLTGLKIISLGALTKILTPFPKSMRNATDFSRCFYQCVLLTGIPENLFANCPNATDFSRCFEDCWSLASIPENLFANCPNATDFSRCFCYCGGLTGKVPELWKRVNVTKYRQCFLGCTSAANYTDIPYDWKN
ncbi:MAG: hypothetical protein ACI4F9_00925 [Lachnospiraceae bacterium]